MLHVPQYTVETLLGTFQIWKLCQIVVHIIWAVSSQSISLKKLYEEGIDKESLQKRTMSWKSFPFLELSFSVLVCTDRPAVTDELFPCRCSRYLPLCCRFSLVRYFRCCEGSNLCKWRFVFVFYVLYSNCLICCSSDSIVSEDAEIESRTVAITALAVRRSNHSDRSHPLLG